MSESKRFQEMHGSNEDAETHPPCQPAEARLQREHESGLEDGQHDFHGKVRQQAVSRCLVILP